MKPHAVCMPVPAQGHINAMMKMAKLLHSKGFHITFVHTESNYNRILQAGSSVQNLDDFRFETIPEALPTSPADGPTNSRNPSFGELVRRLNDMSSGVPPVTCIVSDVFTSFTLEVAAEHRIPDIYFCSVSACAFMGFLQYKQLMERGITPFKSESDLTNGYLHTTIDWIPGIKNIRLRDLPSFIRTTDPEDNALKFVNNEIQTSFKASAIIINTFDELEGPVLKALASMLPPIYTVGPLSLFNCQRPDSKLSSMGSSFWKEDQTCLQWLDGRKPGSVVYVNFGSIAVMTNEHLVEFAWGLANSGHAFLWVIRPDLVKGNAAVLPQEFQEETKGRSLIASWCPQEQVLSHPSIGGFMTHSGWNSTMESISHGVPMLCWPYFGDQQTNCWYVCSEWGIGMEIDNDVKREQVEGLVKELIGGQKGKEMRMKAMDWKERAIKAISPGGSSFGSLDKAITEALVHRKVM